MVSKKKKGKEIVLKKKIKKIVSKGEEKKKINELGGAKGIREQIYFLIEKWRKNKGIEKRDKSVKDLFWDVVESLSYEEEVIFYKELANVFRVRFLSREELEKEDMRVDEEVIRKKDSKEFRDEMYLPLVGRAIITCNPFFVYFTGERIFITKTDFLKFLEERQKDLFLVEEVTGEFEAEKYLDTIFSMAYLMKASDIHLEYDAINDKSVVRLRVDGLLETVKELKGLEYHQRIVNKIFEMSGINAGDFIRIHDKRTSFEIAGNVIPLRVSAVPVNVKGEEKVSNIVMRLLSSGGGKEKKAADFIKLGFLENAIDFLEDIVNLPYGMVLLSGPTGSGKTTTLYNFLLKKREQPVKICTVEDPVEIQLSGITQVETRDAKDEEDRITFSSAIRAFLRHDPDVILIGEIRDKETAIEAVRAALTGHLVFSTVHANTSLAVIVRLLDLGVERFILAETLKVVISQRLVRRICPYCKREVDLYNEKEVEKVFKKPYGIFEKKYKQLLDRMNKVYIGQGCKECGGRGYKGRTIIYDILPVNEDIVKALFEGKYLTEEEVYVGDLQKFSFKEVAFEKIKRGETTIEEVERYIYLGDLSLKE